MSGRPTSGPVVRRAVLDTSVFVARESGRPLEATTLPEETAASVVTVAELHAGVLAAPDTATRARRMATLEAASLVEPLPVTAEAARHWARLRVGLAERGRRAKVNDLWIAAVAAANDMDVVTQDDDVDAIAEAGGPAVVRVSPHEALGGRGKATRPPWRCHRSDSPPTPARHGRDRTIRT